MIKSFKHKGLELFFVNGNKKGINPAHAKRIARILDRLDASIGPRDMNLPGYKLHKLSGKNKEVYSVWVSGNWRITFQFKDKDAIMIDYSDYH